MTRIRTCYKYVILLFVLNYITEYRRYPRVDPPVCNRMWVFYSRTYKTSARTVTSPSIECLFIVLNKTFDRAIPHTHWPASYPLAILIPTGHPRTNHPPVRSLTSLPCRAQTWISHDAIGERECEAKVREHWVQDMYTYIYILFCLHSHKNGHRACTCPDLFGANSYS